MLTYFVVVNGHYLTTSLLGFRTLRRHARRMKSVYLERLPAENGGLPVTVLVPAYDEEASVVETVEALLDLDYPEYDVIVINDGSTDATLERLVDAFSLLETERLPVSEIETEPVRATFRSARHPDLWVIDKENGGKADALNAGLNRCHTPLYCAIDADTLLDREGIVRIVRPFLEDATTIAAGGLLRVANGCEIEDGRVHDVRLPDRLLPRLQVLEYLRAFLFGRLGWDRYGATLVISGAFGMFRRSAVVAAGGYDATTVGEDMELVVRLHRVHREQDEPYRVAFVPDPVAWTECPTTLGGLHRQRARWQRGLGESLSRNSTMLLDPEYGRIGMAAFPYYATFELFGPVIEVLGYGVFLFALAMGWVSWPVALTFLALAVGIGSLLSVTTLGLEEHAIRRYTRLSDFLKLMGYAVLEHLGYRQALAVARLRGTIDWIRGADGWGSAVRRGFESAR